MKLNIPRNELNEAVTGLSRIISANKHVQVLNSIKFFTQDNMLFASAANPEESAVYCFKNAEVEAPGACLLDCNALKHLSRLKNKDRITLEDKGEFIEVLNNISGQVITERLNKLDIENYPEDMPTVSVSATENVFMDYFRRLVPFSAYSGSDDREILRSVHINPEHNVMVATDGKRMTCFRIELPFEAKCSLKLSKFLLHARMDGEIETGTMTTEESTWFALKSECWHYTAICSPGVYPNWRQVIPSDPGSNMITFSDKDISMLEEIMPSFTGNPDKHVAVTFVNEKGKTKVYGHNVETRIWTKIELPGSTYQGSQSLFTVNRKFLLEMLRCGFRTLRINDSTSPLYAESANAKHVLMPLTPEVPEGVVLRNIQKETEIQPQEEVKQEMPEKTENQETQGAMEKILAAYQLARAKIKEANSALADIAIAMKEAAREDRSRKNELNTARETLAKLQTIRI